MPDVHTSAPSATRVRLWLRRRTPLSIEDTASRITAYVYGNIVVLSSLVPLSQDDAETGRSFWIVLGVSLATFLAHALAESAGRSARSHRSLRPKEFVNELRDSVPVVTSGLVPAFLLLAAWLGDLPGHQAQLFAEGYVLLRLASTGIAIGRARGECPSARTFGAGVGTAAAGALITLLKLSAG